MKKTRILEILEISIITINFLIPSYQFLFLKNLDPKHYIHAVMLLCISYICTTKNKNFLIANFLGFSLTALHITYPSINYGDHNSVIMSIFLFLIIYLNQSLNKYKTEKTKLYGAVVAHELYAPIYFLTKKISEIEKSCKINLSPIKNISKYCANTINTLINIARYFDKDQEVFLVHKSIIKCAKQAIKEFNTLEYVKISLVKNHDFEFYGSATLVKHIIFNLLKNSLLHGKHITSIKIYAENNTLYFYDDGIGIQKSDIKHIFEFGFSSNYFGLGLNFCKHAMEDMGGSIKCVSEYKKYTKFIMKFKNRKPLWKI